MDKKIIVLSGKQYSGKDTVAKILLEGLQDFIRVGIGDSIKREYGLRHGLTLNEIEENKHKYRGNLIELGNWGRSIDPDYWLKKIIEIPQNVIVPDARVVHEIELFKKHNAFLIRVESDYNSRSKRGIVTNNDDSTETDLDNYSKWDYIIENNSDYNSLKNACKALEIKIKEVYLY